MFVLAALAIVMLVLCDDMMSLVCPIFCIFLSSIEFYRDYSVLTDYMWYAIVPFAAALIFNLVYYRTPFVKGRFFYPQLAVSVALSLGGLFCIPAKQYFSPSAPMYVLSIAVPPKTDRQGHSWIRRYYFWYSELYSLYRLF